MAATASRRSNLRSSTNSSAHGAQVFYSGATGSDQLFITNDGSHNILRIPVPSPDSFRCLGCDYASNQHRKMKQHWQRMCIKASVVIWFACSVCKEEFRDIRIAKGHFTRLHSESAPQPTSQSLELEGSVNGSESSGVVRSELRDFLENQDWEGSEGASALASVAPSAWLNDKIINYGVAKICLEESVDQGRKFAFLSSQVVPALRAMRENPDVIREVVKPWHLESDVLSIPIIHHEPERNTSVHWSLLLADDRIKAFVHIDSIKSTSHDTHAELVAQSLAAFVDEHLGSNRLLQYQFSSPASSQQTDGKNCGIFTILHNRCYLSGSCFTGIKSTDCQLWRESFAGIQAKDIPSAFTDASAAVVRQPAPQPHPKPISDNGDFDFLNFGQSINASRVLHHIPRGARPTTTDALTKLLSDVTDTGSTESWVRLFKFPSECLSKPSATEKVSNLTTYVKNRIARFMSAHAAPESAQNVSRGNFRRKRPVKTANAQLAASVAAKLADADVRGALRLLTSSDTLAPNDASTYKSLQEKHPQCQTSLQLHNPVEPTPILVSRKSLRLAIKGFPSGSSGGWDGLRPQHLQDLTRPCLGTLSDRLLLELSRFAQKILQGSIPPSVAEVFFGARLIALSKNSGGIRPIAVGLTLRRICGKVCNEAILGKAVPMFSPRQVGFGVKKGAEAAVHSLRRFLLRNQTSGLAMLKIDFKNAFNTISRDRVLQEVKHNFPEALPFVYAAYSRPSALFWQNRVIWSQEGVQQGDPLGPFLFCLAIDALTQRLRAQVSVWYLDDGCLVGDRETLLGDFQEIIQAGSTVGLQVNSAKCEFTVLSSDPQQVIDGHRAFRDVAEGIQCVELSSSTLLGAALHPDGADALLMNKVQELDTMCERLSLLDRHDALFLLRHSFGIPRLVYTLRTSPCYGCDALRLYDKVLHSTLEGILNCALSDLQWQRAALPVYAGGLGIRRASDVCLPAFIASVTGSQPLANRISNLEGADTLLQQALADWDTICHTRPQERTTSQREWDRMLSKSQMDHLLSRSDLTPFDRAIFLAAKTRSSGDWLNALPLPQLGLKLSDAEVRIAAGLRVGSDVIHSHACVCGAPADAKGIHGLSCAKVAGRAIRHTSVNQLIQRSLNSADFRAILEPPGLSRSDQKQPDGITLVPWRRGKCLMWDFSCKSTVAQSNISKTCKEAASAAEEGARLKHRKYVEVAKNYEFVPVVVESHGSLCKEACSFLTQLGRHLERKTDEPLSTAYLRQRISVAVQKGNARCILGTLGDQHLQKSSNDVLEELISPEDDGV